MIYKRVKSTYEFNSTWEKQSKSLALSLYGNICSICRIDGFTTKSHRVYPLKYTNIDKYTSNEQTVCMCSDCYKSVNRMMLDDTDFVIMIQNLKKLMNENEYRRLFVYSLIDGFKDDYLNQQIELYKKTKDVNLQEKLIRKVLSLPIN